MVRAAACLLTVLAAFPLKASGEKLAPSSIDKPSASDVQMAMDNAFAQEIHGQTDLLWGDCMAVRQLRCSPARQGRSTCTYAYQHGRGTATLQRNVDGSWRWISGPYHCTMGVISK